LLAEIAHAGIDASLVKRIFEVETITQNIVIRGCGKVIEVVEVSTHEIICLRQFLLCKEVSHWSL
jgi:hypothetical protein